MPEPEKLEVAASETEAALDCAPGFDGKTLIHGRHHFIQEDNTMLAFKQIRLSSVSGLLLLSLVGLLIAYLIVVGNLPSWARVPAQQAYPRYSWIYTRAQQEFLEYNSRRNVSQAALTLI